MTVEIVKVMNPCEGTTYMGQIRYIKAGKVVKETTGHCFRTQQQAREDAMTLINKI